MTALTGDGADRWRNVLLLYLLAGITTASHGSAELIFPLNLDRLGYPYGVIGLTVALIGLGSLLSRLPGGAWYHHTRARWSSAAALAVMGLSTLGLALGDWWTLQAGLSLLHGFAFGLSTTFTLALLIEVRPKDESIAPTMAWFTAAISTGYTVGAPLGAESIERFGHGGAFLVSGFVGILGGALALALRPPRAEPEPSGRAEGRPSGVRAHAWHSLKGLPVVVWLATLLGLYVNFLSDTVGTFFPIYALDIGIALGVIGLLKAFHSLAATGIRFAAVGLFRFVPVGAVNHSAVVATALATVGLSFVSSEPLLAAIFIVLGACRGLLRVTSATMVAEERKRPGGSVGMASGVYNAGFDAGTMLGPPVAGALAGALGIPTTFRVVALALPAVYYGLWFAQRMRQGRAPTTDAARAS